MKKKIIVLVLGLAFAAGASAQAQPLVKSAYSTVLPRLFGKTMEANAKARGFAANDPRFAATNAAVSSRATTLSTGAGALGTVAQVAKVGPPWLSLALTAVGVVVGAFDFGATEIDATGYQTPDDLVKVKPLYGPVEPIFYQPVLSLPVPAYTTDSRSGESWPNAYTHVYSTSTTYAPVGDHALDADLYRKGANDAGQGQAKYGKEYLAWPDQAKYVIAPSFNEYSATASASRLAISTYGGSPEEVLTEYVRFKLMDFWAGYWNGYGQNDSNCSGSNPRVCYETLTQSYSYPTVSSFTFTDVTASNSQLAVTYPRGTRFYSVRYSIRDVCLVSVAGCPTTDRGTYTATVPVMPNPLFKGQAEVSVDNLLMRYQSADATLSVDDSLTISMVNKLWADASAAPDYQGVPFDALNPVTEAQLKSVIAANPELAPKVGDYLSPAYFPNTSYVPIGDVLPDGQPLPTIAPYSNVSISQNTGTAPSGSIETCGLPGKPACQVEWGSFAASDPDTAGATSELGTAIRNNPFGSWIGHAFTVSPGVCPELSLELWGKTISAESHCQVMEGTRNVASLIFGVVWLLVAFRLVLSA